MGILANLFQADRKYEDAYFTLLGYVDGRLSELRADHLAAISCCEHAIGELEGVRDVAYREVNRGA